MGLGWLAWGFLIDLPLGSSSWVVGVMQLLEMINFVLLDLASLFIWLRISVCTRTPQDPRLVNHHPEMRGVHPDGLFVFNDDRLKDLFFRTMSLEMSLYVEDEDLDEAEMYQLFVELGSGGRNNR